MTAREQIIKELGQVSDTLAEEVLDFLLFAKSRQAQKPLIDEENQRSQPSILERMGGLPQHLLSVGNLSDRDSKYRDMAKIDSDFDDLTPHR
jgi:hypothetical protein